MKVGDYIEYYQTPYFIFSMYPTGEKKAKLVAVHMIRGAKSSPLKVDAIFDAEQVIEKLEEISSKVRHKTVRNIFKIDWSQKKL